MEKDSSLEKDSDYENDDLESFTENRIRMKKLRYNYSSNNWLILQILILFRYTRQNEQKPQTKLIDQDENKEFISEFEEWQKSQVLETSQESQDTVR